MGYSVLNKFLTGRHRVPPCMYIKKLIPFYAKYANILLLQSGDLDLKAFSLLLHGQTMVSLIQAFNFFDIQFANLFCVAHKIYIYKKVKLAPITQF